MSSEFFTATKRQEILDMVEEFKNGLMAQATDGGMEDTKYRKIRKTIMGLPFGRDQIPKSIRVCSNTGEFRRHLQAQYEHYRDRREHITNEFAPLIEAIENAATTLPDEIEIGEEIGSGGFGRIFRVSNELLNMNFALKVLDPSFDDGDQSTLDRFFREARILFTLNHPNIIRVYDVGLINGKPFIKMELFQGKNLNNYLSDHGCMSLPKAKSLIVKISEALHHAHTDIRVVHRDLKPSNIMVAPVEQVKVIDFGLGVFIENDIISRITQTGESAVTGYYTAPELLKNPKLLNPSTDIYSIGAIWYTVLVGTAPAGTRIIDNLKTIRGISDRYIRVLSKCLENSSTRYKSCRDLLADLNTI